MAEQTNGTDATPWAPGLDEWHALTSSADAADLQRDHNITERAA